MAYTRCKFDCFLPEVEDKGGCHVACAEQVSEATFDEGGAVYACLLDYSYCYKTDCLPRP